MRTRLLVVLLLVGMTESKSDFRAQCEAITALGIELSLKFEPGSTRELVKSPEFKGMVIDLKWKIESLLNNVTREKPLTPLESFAILGVRSFIQPFE